MENKSIKEVIIQGKLSNEYQVFGWVKSFRNNRFIALNDGSCLSNIQCVLTSENHGEEFIKTITVGCSLRIHGTLVESQGRGQSVEIDIQKIEVLGIADSEDVRKTILSPKYFRCGDESSL